MKHRRVNESRAKSVGNPATMLNLPDLAESLSKAEALKGGHETVEALKQKVEVKEIVCPKCGTHCEIPNPKTLAVSVMENAGTFLAAQIVAESIQKAVARLARPGTVEWCKSILEKKGYTVEKPKE